MKFKAIIILFMLVATSALLSAQGLKVMPGTCVKVTSGTTLDIGVGDLILKSDSTCDASLIDFGSVTYSGEGSAKVERYLSYLNNGLWHLISPPVDSAVSGMFLDDYLQEYNETTGSWSDIIQVDIPLIPAKGYALWTVNGAATTEVFVGGKTNTGNQTHAFTKSSYANAGWNLVGNPYPSVLDWEGVAIPAGLYGAIYLFKPKVGGSGDYHVYISDGGTANTHSQYIPSGQGFFVYANAAGTLTFNNDARTHNVEQEFYKSAVENKMLVMKVTGNNITTQTAIRFNPDATSFVDRLYDAFRLVSGSSDVPVVYTKCEDKRMAINTLPSVKEHETVPMFFEAGVSGEYVFTATEIESLDDDVPVFLEDIASGYIQNLRLNPVYSFDYSAGAVKNFNVYFKDVLGVEEPLAETVKFNCHLNDGRLMVNYNGAEPFGAPATIAVYNLAGQQLLQTETAQPHTEIPFHGSAAMYIVHIIYNQSSYNQKIINQKQ